MGGAFVALNIAWGYDAGDSYAYVTTNISPGVPSASIDFFYTNEVVEILDECGDSMYPRT